MQKGYLQSVTSLVLITLMSLAISSSQSLAEDPIEPKESNPKPKKPPLWELRLGDDSNLKLGLREEKIEIVTPYGKLTIPSSEIRRIDVGMRIPSELKSKIDLAISDLGSPQYRKREEAMTTLVEFREKAYGAILQASKNPDSEVAKRADELLSRLQTMLPEERLKLPEYDVIHTETCKIAGKIVSPTLKTTSPALGEIEIKLVDVVSIRSGSGDIEDKTPAMANPGSLFEFRSKIGETLRIQVTGVRNGSLWGTDMYTLDSTLGMAAVHAGVLKDGQSGVVKVVILPPQVNFQGSIRNGIASNPYDQYPGAFRFVK